MLKKLIALACFVALDWFVLATAGWPFMGDSTYIHYVVFLTQHGMAPFRDIVEINMPFAYLVEHMAMAIFGAGPVGWRIFDFLLIGIVLTSCYQLLKNNSRVAGVFAGSLFAIVHGQDGVMMAGERDFVVAVCQLAALVCLKNSGALGGTETPVISTGATASPSRSGEICCFQTSHPPRTTNQQAAWLFGFGFLASAAMNLKPPAILFLAVTLIWLFFQKKQSRIFLPIAAGVTLPVLMSLTYLLHYSAVGAFRTTLNGLIRYHSQIERKPLSFLLTHAFSPVLALCAVYLLIELLWRDRKRSPLEILLALSAAAGWIGYCIQGKGFAYQRYPFLLFLLVLMSSVLFSAFRKTQGHLVRGLGYAYLLLGLGMMFFFDHRMATYSHADPFAPLSIDLETLGGKSLSGSVQCMDTAGGCIASLYNEKLVQSTGFIYDCYFQDEKSPVAQELRLRFETAINQNPPHLLIVTDSVCFAGKRSFNKFETWPWFNAQLAGQYHLVRDRKFLRPTHYWSRTDIPFSYRIYERN